jgi:hypothetical protein
VRAIVADDKRGLRRVGDELLVVECGGEWVGECVMKESL